MSNSSKRMLTVSVGSCSNNILIYVLNMKQQTKLILFIICKIMTYGFESWVQDKKIEISWMFPPTGNPPLTDNFHSSFFLLLQIFKTISKVLNTFCDDTTTHT